MYKFLIAVLLCLSTTLTAEIKVLAFAGSSRADSINKKLINEAAAAMRDGGANVTVIDLKDYPMPFYDGDLEANMGMSENAKKVRRLMIDSDVIVIASPEYNGSISGLLKNTLDWASRSETGGGSREAFKGKKFVLMSASPGQTGGSRGLVHLRQVIQDVGGEVASQQFSLPNAYGAFDGNGYLKDQAERAKLFAFVKQNVLK